MTTREARSSTPTPARGRAGSPGAFRPAVDLIEVPRNPGIPLDLGWVRDIRINRSAVERRAATIPTRRSIKTAWQAGWLLRAISLIDLTTLAGDDTPGRVLRLCAKARSPIRPDGCQSRHPCRGEALPRLVLGERRHRARTGAGGEAPCPRRC